MDWPMIYCNGDSYSDENYHPSMERNTYGYHVGESLGGFVISKSIRGSCNRRILRTSTHDLLQQRQLNPTQTIIALINLSFEIRDEIWVDEKIATAIQPEESNFVTHQFSYKIEWGKDLQEGGLTDWQNRRIDDSNRYLKSWSEGRAFFYSSYAERTNLLMDLVLFCSFLDLHDIKYLIFQGPLAEKLESEYLIDFFKTNLDPDKVIDLESFGFCQWCCDQGYKPLDDREPAHIGHYRPDAHESFARQFLLPKLRDLYGL